MQRQQRTPVTKREITHSFRSNAPGVPTQEESLGQVVAEILRAGEAVTRTSICTKLLAKLDQTPGADMEKHYHALIALVLGREER
ncbi:regulatory protein YcgZ [Nissabacter sp. SGAir0207]|uniref:regulatory protein YcgZ n=1 Tax=Nissabacter sp. SGAir0207 TaxID=2126321 RepID=UPI0010CD5590|nr:regulatory protein YcgZ [Nissabacter sp. SGAir0207]QCR38137.1 two-component-system connector protein YcgZ [Nissabacter sp. SGAir0207]